MTLHNSILCNRAARAQSTKTTAVEGSSVLMSQIARE